MSNNKMDLKYSIYAVIVTYNATKNDWIRKCLNSLVNSDMPCPILVIDNASTDETNLIIEEEFPNVELIKSTENLGFAKANNLGIDKAMKSGADYVFLLNQDAWVEPDTLSKLSRSFQENEEFGILSPIHLNGSGNLLDFNFQKFLTNDNYDGRLLISDAFKGKYTQAIYQIKRVNAACWLMSRNCIEQIGLFNAEEFPHYGEDSDYIFRALQKGIKLGVVPNCFIFHDREERKGEKSKNKFNSFAKMPQFKTILMYEPERTFNFVFVEIVRLFKFLFTFKISSFFKQLGFIFSMFFELISYKLSSKRNSKQ